MGGDSIVAYCRDDHTGIGHYLSVSAVSASDAQNASPHFYSVIQGMDQIDVNIFFLNTCFAIS